MNNVLSFGQIVKEHRQVLALTQAELARRVACAPITVRKIESDARRPSQQIAERLAMSLNIPLDERATFVRLARLAMRETPEPSPLPTPPPRSTRSARRI
jgi:ribosome-binding protein aMBF1 (putative translation factor)